MPDLPVGVKRTSLLVYKHNHGLVRLFCPFKVIAMLAIQDQSPGASFIVEYVQFNPNMPFFKIENELLPCYYFAIII